jgi:hypothetical protein
MFEELMERQGLLEEQDCPAGPDDNLFVVEVPEYPGDDEHDRAARLHSAEAARRMLADPAMRGRIEAALEELDRRPPGPTMTGDEFLASVGFAPSAP